jgi:two-component system cell cycle sensor histidine kinase/response regulator CckA
MTDPSRTNTELIQENALLKQRIRKLERTESERLSMEKAYKDSELKYRSLIEHSSDVMFCVDENGEYKFVNEVFALTFGKTPDYFLGKTFWDIYPKEHADHRQAASRKVFETGESQSVEVVVPLPDRTLYYIAKANPVKDETGKVVLNLTHAIDITERKQADERARRLAQENAAMAEIGRIISSTLNIDEVYEAFAVLVKQVLPFDRIVISIICSDKNTTRNVYIAGEGILERNKIDIYPIEGSGHSEMMRTKSTVLIQTEDFREYRDRFPRLWSTFQAGFRSIMNVPLFSKGEIIGALLLRSRKYPAYAEADLHLAERIGTQIAGAVANAQLFSNLNETEKSLRESDERFSSLVSNIPGIVFRCLNDSNWTMLFISGEIYPISNYPASDFINNSIRSYASIIHSEDRGLVDRAIQKGVKEKARYSIEYRICSANGSIRWVHERGQGIFSSEGNLLWLDGVILDITDHKKAEMALLESRDRFHGILASLDDAIFLVNPVNRLIYECNAAATRIFGYSHDELVGKETDFLHVNHAHFEQFGREAMAAYKDPGYYAAEFEMRRKDGVVFPTEHFVRPIRNSDGQIMYVLSVVRDITERKQMGEAKAKLEAQLQQSQKMESVGRLAGGVAHDFNNMLGVIVGHTEMAMEKVDPAQPLYADLTEIHKAANRSADLTRQLLAFARKQTVSPKVLDLNETVESMLKMLQRLIGEDIHLAWLPGINLWPVKIDPSQIDQILANLSVNARDAIAGVGKLTIETRNVRIDEAYCTDHAGSVPGEHVLLSVSDNGRGMDKETLGKLFEPFFTTKELGKGTGLGLAMVYGIVKQNSGFINVYSEPDLGTTFMIYLPRHVGKAEQVKTEGPPEPVMRGQETILLAEDEPAIMDLTRILLERQGYTVLAASTPGEAIRLAREHAGDIHMLMTDVVMPEMNGRDLAKNLLALYPHLKRLFTSGYTANVIAHNGVLDEGVHFIQKPFSKKDLAAKVREVLDQE